MHQPPIHNTIQRVTNFTDLVATQLKGSTNVACWEREFIGDYYEIIQQCVSNENITVIEPEFAQFGRWVKLRNVNRKIVLLNMFRRRHLNRQNYFLTVGEFRG